MYKTEAGGGGIPNLTVVTGHIGGVLQRIEENFNNLTRAG